ncbi:MAG: MTH938/NDUFAF3 family protein [Steroidobacteraceae bacterium]|jgi:uncharacterized protein|nr:MTH938/NDUFAF3 family protein [Steroidobacteraceae bacterium]
MKFTLEAAGPVNAITARGSGEIRVRERVFTASVVLTARDALPDWNARDAASLTLDDLDAVFALGPDLVVLGTGERQVFPPAALLAHAARRGIGLEVMDNAAACRTYNVLLHEGRNVAVALILG